MMMMMMMMMMMIVVMMTIIYNDDDNYDNDDNDSINNNNNNDNVICIPTFFHIYYINKIIYLISNDHHYLHDYHYFHTRHPILIFTYSVSGRYIPEPFTPPYVSHLPDITHIQLDRNDR